MTRNKEVRCRAALERMEKELKRGQSQESIERGITFETWQRNKKRDIQILRNKLGIT